MHILHIETGRNLYGGALQVRYLLEGLAEYGCRNTLVCPEGSAISIESRPFATVHQVSIGGDVDPRFLFYLLRVVCRERPDLLHVHSRRGADLWGGIASRLSATKSVITRRVDNPERRLVARVKYRMYDRVVTISERIRNVLLSEGIPEDKLVCVPSAVDHRLYRNPCRNEWFRDEFGLRPAMKVIGVIAQLIPRKGHRFLIQAAPDILESCPETRFIFFGQGPLQEQLELLCRKKGLDGKISFVGFRKDLEKILPCLYMVVHPATMEGLGVSLLQASAAGVPIVAARTGGISEIVKEKQNGYLVPVGDVDALARAVISLLKNPDKAKNFGRKGEKMVRSLFSLGKMVAGNLEVYRQILSSTSSDARPSGATSQERRV
jgi:glycosyltransferase involved in cell wall biosynthesis